MSPERDAFTMLVPTWKHEKWAHMKTAHLKRRFYDFGKLLIPPFIHDTSAKGDPKLKYINQIYAVMKRSVVPGQWQFLMLHFHPNNEGIFLELALSPDEDYFRSGSMTPFADPESYQPGQSLFYRASRLWTYENGSDCWLIRQRLLDITNLYKEAGTTDQIELSLYLFQKYTKPYVDNPVTINTLAAYEESFEAQRLWEERLFYKAECFFRTDNDAMDDIEHHIKKWVLPYFERMAAKHQ